MHVSAASFAFKAQVGNAYTVGARDEEKRPTGLAARLHRAQANYFETFPIFAALVLVVQVAGKNGDLSLYGAILYMAARVLFLPLYAAGVPWVRTLTWNAATLGLTLVGAQVFF